MRMLIAALAIVVVGCEVSTEPVRVARRRVSPAASAVLRSVGELPPKSDGIFYTSNPFALAAAMEEPVANIPVEARQRNYGGSCVCASTISALRWVGRDDLAAKIREICSGGQTSSSIQAHCTRAGVTFACTTNGDVSLLDYAFRTRRACTVFWKPVHACTLVHFDKGKAIILDNNSVTRYETTPREEFIRKWRSWGGFALVPLYAPSPPIAYTN